jgi:hypothetical protein
MGNQSSSCTTNSGAIKTSGNPFRKSTGRLGLSREELDKRCKPSGLYDSCMWETKAIRRLVGDGKLAARLAGSDNRQTDTDQECPICFLHYPEINMLNCCKATICSECFLQIQNARGGNSCPFCNKPKMTVSVAKSLDDLGILKREEDEQKVIEAKIRAKFGNGGSTRPASAPLTTNTTANANANANTPETSASFGSNLEADQQSRSRSRTLSCTKKDIIVAMSPHERRVLEEEMRSQRNHPLMRQMSLNAERDRQRHEYEYRQRTNERRMDSHLRLEELLNRRASAIVGDRERREFNRRLSVITGVNDESSDEEETEAHERMDDLFMIEAALYLSMRDREGRPRINSNRNGNGNGGSGGGGGGIDNGNGGESNSNNANADENSGTGSNRRGGGRSSRNRARNGLDPQNLIQALLSGRSVIEGDYSGGLSEDAQLELAIQLSLQQQQEESSHQQSVSQAEGTGDTATTSTGTNVDNNVAAAAAVDHGEEEIVFSS